MGRKTLGGGKGGLGQTILVFNDTLTHVLFQVNHCAVCSFLFPDSVPKLRLQSRRFLFFFFFFCEREPRSIFE